jgi:hypothetical protein
MTIVRGTVSLQLYGRGEHGAVNGALAAPVAVNRAAGPLVAAFAWTWLRDYNAVALALAVLAASAIGCFALAVRTEP